MAGSSPYPEGFDLWTQDRRNLFFKQSADAYDRKRHDEERQAKEPRPNHPYVESRKPNGVGDAPPDRAPPIGEPIKTKLFPIERWEDITFDLNEEFLIDGVMPKRGVGVIFGASGTFKSFLTMHTSLCTARRLTWAGRSVEFAPVVYVGAEGAAGLRKRKLGYEAIWLRDAAKIGAEPPTDIAFALISAAPNLGTMDGDLPALIATIDSIGGPSPGLIVIDTAAKVMGAADENNQGAAALLSNGEALAQHYGCFVLFVHHTGWGDDAQKRTRGWSGLPFGLDLIMLCERKPGELSVTITIQKLKDDESGERFIAKLERVELGKTKTGRQVSTLVVDSVTQIENATPVVATGVTNRPQTKKKLLNDTLVKAIAEEGETLFAINPNIRGVYDDIVHGRYDAAIAEPNPDADPKKAANQRRVYNRMIKDMLDEKILEARQIRGRRMLWFA